MAIFTEEELQNSQAVIEAAIRENFPNISVRRGTVMKELVAKASTIGYAVVTKLLEEFKATDSLSAIAENPTAVDDSVIDAILSNWFIARKHGTLASGIVKVIMLTTRSLFLKSGTKFTAANGLVYVSISDAVVEFIPSSAASIQLHQDTGTGNYYFLLPITAEAVGEAYAIPQDTQLDNASIGADFVLATAFTDFSGGTDTETSSELLTRAQQSITVRDLVTTKSIRAVLKDVFSAVEDIAVIGYGDPEMLRDHLANLGFGAGGRVNIYIRNSRDPVMTTLRKTLDVDSKFELSEVPTEVPFYRIEKIIPVDSPGLTLDDFTVDFSLALNPPNDLQGKLFNGRFTIYERAEVTINTAGYAGTDVYVKITQPPQVQDIQLYVLDEDNRVVSADLLVLGMIPVFVKVEIELVRPLFGVPVSVADIKSAVKTYINTIPAGSTLDLSKIVQIVQGFSITRLNLTKLKVTGELRKPDGNTDTLIAVDALEVPTDRAIGLSQRNTAYFATVDDILITEITK